MNLLAGQVSYEVARRPILSDVAFAVREGECVAIVGPNGAGKTTLLRLIAGVLRPTAGELELRGVDYCSLKRRELARTLAYVPQARPVRVPLSVRDAVLLGRYPHAKPWPFGMDARDFLAVSEALRIVGMEDLADRSLSELSGGERQRAYIAAALAQESECLILDEPTTFLDPGHQKQIAGLLASLLDRHGRTVVLASHDLNLALALADRVIAIDGGTIAAAGATGDILRAPFLEGFYSAPFRIDSSHGSTIMAVDLGVSRRQPDKTTPS